MKTSNYWLLWLLALPSFAQSPQLKSGMVASLQYREAVNFESPCCLWCCYILK